MQKDIVVEMPQGKIVGCRYLEDSINVFKGIPYGLPPVGELRWRPCQKAPDWDGIKSARNFSPACVQPELERSAFYYSPAPAMSEDCLYLNLWVPEGGGRDLPVMVWIHGGALVDGSGATAAYDGTGLAKKGVIVVTFNYRLNIFGFFSHPLLTQESNHDASGNYGITDQLELLRWVQRNIAAFGGDASNVTVFGESAGALSILGLLSSSHSTGLFHKAILQSPYLPALTELKEAEEIGRGFASTLSVSELDAMRALPAQELLKKAGEQGVYMDFCSASLVRDGWLFDKQIYECLESFELQEVPIIVGFNSGECESYLDIPGLLPPIPTSEAEYVAAVEARFEELSTSYINLYPAERLKQSILSAARDGQHGWAVEKLARSFEEMNSNCYLYYFNHHPQQAEAQALGAFHGSEILYSLDNIQHYEQYSPPNWPQYKPSKKEVELSNVISNYWVSFAISGKPVVNGFPDWKNYCLNDKNFLTFCDGEAIPEVNLLPGMFELHESIILKRRAANNLDWNLTNIGLLAPIATV